MAYAMTKQGTLDNCVTYEFICDTITDMNAIEDRYRTIGTVAIVLNGSSNGLEVYICGSDKVWKEFNTIGSGNDASENSSSPLTIHICSSEEYVLSNGLYKPTIAEPEANTIYLVPSNGYSGDIYDEYVYVNNKWERFGSGSIQTSLNSLATDKANKADTVLTTTLSLGRKANTTIGQNSVALGTSVIASGTTSHAEGGNTEASGMRAHAEGGYTKATEMDSHAEGYGSQATGGTAHAEGYYTEAYGANSHSEGGYTLACGPYQHVSGYSNVPTRQYTSTITDAETIEYTLNTAYLPYEYVFKDNSSGTTLYYLPHSYIPDCVYPSYDARYASKYWISTTVPTGTNIEEILEWNRNTNYEINTIVKQLELRTNNYQYFKSKSAVPANASYELTDTALFHTQPINTQYSSYTCSTPLEIVGNSPDKTLYSNARTLDWRGNERLNGDLYINCNADSTGGTKVIPLPTPPTTDGTYTLQLVVSDGVPTYSWIGG